MTTDTAVPRLLGGAAALLLFLGLLTGGYAAFAMTGQLPADPHAALAAHLNGLLGAFLLLGVAWSVPLLGYGDAGLRRLAWLFIVPSYANWLVTAVKAWLHVAGLGRTGEPANDAVFVVLNLTVVLPSLVAAAAWFEGFRRGR